MKPNGIHMLTKDANFNKQFRIFDKYFVRDKHAALWVNKIEGEFHLIPLTAFEFDVMVDDNTNQVTVMILTYDRKDFKEYALWTDIPPRSRSLKRLVNPVCPH